MKTLATDLDGTLYLDNILIPGVKDSYELLLANNYYIYHATNNSSQSRQIIASKLERLLQVDIDLSSVITPLVVLEDYLKGKNYSVYVFGSDEIKQYISNISNLVTNLETADLVILGRVDFPNEDELDEIAKGINSGIAAATLNKDLTYPVSPSEFKPGNGQIARYIESATRKTLDSFGKDGMLFSDYFINKGIQIDYMIGDRVDTDIVFAKNINTTSILVNSSIENHMPVSLADEVFDTFNEFVSSIVK